MRSNNPKSKNASSKIDLTQISLAVIGALGTIVVAYFAYLQSTRPKEIEREIELTRIAVTQTAISEGTRVAAIATSSTPAVSGIDTLTPTLISTPTVVQSVIPESNTPEDDKLIYGSGLLDNGATLLTEVKQWKLRLDDKFDSNKNKWATSTLNAVNTKLDLATMKYTWLVTPTQQFSHIETLPISSDVSDFYLSVECKRVSGNGSPCGIAFRISDKGNYNFRIKDIDQTFYFYSMRPGDRKDFMNGFVHSDKIRRNETNQIAVVAKGNRFDFYINDEYLAYVELSDVTYNELPSGKIGLLVAPDKGDNAMYEFDNLELRVP